MRVSIFILFACCLITDPTEQQTEPVTERVVITERQHHFQEIYSYIRNNIEGNYVNNPHDKGKETYGGISRRFYPNWYGWKYVDQAKPLKRHGLVPAAEPWVMDFYLTLWVRDGFENINDFDLALNLFDFRVHSSARSVQTKTNKALQQMNECPVIVKDGWITDQFNHIDTEEFMLRLKIQRLILFNSLVTRTPDQKTFYKGWVLRLENI